MLAAQLQVPIVLAPLGGGPSTPELTAAVSEAGALGILAWAYLDAEQAQEALAATRALTTAPIGVNVFAPVPGPAPPDDYDAYVASLRDWAQREGVPLGEPRFGDDDWGAKIELLVADPVPVVSFAFGCPDRDTLGRLRQAGCETWVTVTSPEEAVRAVGAGADALVVQGFEAGGHRGGFGAGEDSPQFGLLALLELVRAEVEQPLVATGGIADGAGIAAALAAGAQAAQLGSAFMLAEEAGTSSVHRAALRSATPTRLTQAFTGRPARGIENRFIREHPQAPAAYPELHYVTAPFRQAGRERGDRDLVNLWAGQAHALALELPAGEIVERLERDAAEALDGARRRMRR